MGQQSVTIQNEKQNFPKQTYKAYNALNASLYIMRLGST
jgi:hypothetical protein